MTLESISQEAEPIRKAAAEAYDSVRQDAGELLSCASEQIRKNPIPIVIGAVAFGIAVGCLVMSGRHGQTLQERYFNEPLDTATEAISTTLGRLYGNLKFW